MYKWSRQQLLELQATANREALLRNHQPQLPVDHSPPSQQLPMFRLQQNLAVVPQSSVSTSNSVVILTLQAKLDALKRQNQDAISKLLKRRQLDDIVSPTSVMSNRQALVGAFTTKGLVQPEQNPLLNHVSTQRRPYQDDMIQSLLAQSEVFEKEKQDDTNDTQVVENKKLQQAVLEAEYSDPKPKRPLSAYNLFFQEQRQMILDNPSKNDKRLKSTEDGMTKPSSTDSLTETTVSTFHSDGGEENPKKRKRYEPHHKMSFESMAKTIANRWKETVYDEDKMRPYQDVAKVEKERYMRELAQWKQRRRQRLHHKC